MDGVGGSVKRIAWMWVRSRKCHVAKAAEFVSAVIPKTKAKVILATQDTLNQAVENDDDENVFCSVDKHSGTSEDHYRISTSQSPIMRLPITPRKLSSIPELSVSEIYKRQMVQCELCIFVYYYVLNAFVFIIHAIYLPCFS